MGTLYKSRDAGLAGGFTQTDLRPLPWQEGERAAATTPKKPYGNVPYADPGYQADKKARYPIDCERVMAAWSYIHQADNRTPYTAAQLSAIEGRIKAAMTRCGHKVSADGGSSTRSLTDADRAAFVKRMLGKP